MYLRRLFREPGPPRSATQERRPVSISGEVASTAPLPARLSFSPQHPLSQGRQNWQTDVVDRRAIDKHNDGIHIFDEEANRSNAAIRHDPVYPGLNLKPVATYESVYPRSFASVTHSKPPLPKGKVTWKRMLFSPKHEAFKTGPEKGSRVLSRPHVEEQHALEQEPLPGLGTLEESEPCVNRNVVQRALEAWKRRRGIPRRSRSVDDTRLTISQAVYLPNNDNLQQHPNGSQRRSLDGRLESITSRPGQGGSRMFDESLVDPTFEMMETVKGEVVSLPLPPGIISASAQPFDASGGPTSKLNNPLPAVPSHAPFAKGTPIPHSSTEDSFQTSPMVPMKLHPAPAWTQARLGSAMHMSSPSLSRPQRCSPRPPLERPLSHPAEAGKSVNWIARCDWQQQHSVLADELAEQAAENQKAKHGPANDSSPGADQQYTLPATPNGQPFKGRDMSEKRHLRKISSTTITSDELHGRLANLLQEEHLRLAKGKTKEAVSSWEKHAVIRPKQEPRRGIALARLFARQDKEVATHEKETEPPVVNENEMVRLHSQLDELAGMHRKAKEDDKVILDITRTLRRSVQPRRGFAEKMFADAAVGQTVMHMRCAGEDQRSSPISPSQTSPATPASPLSPDVTARTAQRCSTPPFKGKRPDGVTYNDLFLVSPTAAHHLSHVDCGSLGPPTELAEQELTLPLAHQASDAQKRREQDHGQLVPQFGRSEDLVVPGWTTESLCSGDGHQADAEIRRRDSLAGSQIDTINRIHSWRNQTGATPVKILYAPSASTTEPSTFCRRTSGRHRGETESQLTSISRRPAIDHTTSDIRNTNGEQSGPALSNALGQSKLNASQPLDPQHGALTVATKPPSSAGHNVKACNEAVEKLVDVASPPTTVARSAGGGTSHIRQLSEEDSKRLFRLLEWVVLRKCDASRRN